MNTEGNMCRCVALLFLMLTTVAWFANGGTVVKYWEHSDWDEDKDVDDDWNVKPGEETEYKNGMNYLSHLFKDARSSGKELNVKLHRVLYAYQNKKDPLIDLDHTNTLHVLGEFASPELQTEICGVIYTLPAVHMTTKFASESCPGAMTRGAPPPKMHILDQNSDGVHDGLYTLIGVSRAPIEPGMGDFQHPFIMFMTINIHGSDTDTGDVVIRYGGVPYSPHFAIFLYEQHDVIQNDFAISHYTSWDECAFSFHCQFQQADFVSDYNLKLRWTGHISVSQDPYTPHFLRNVIGQLNQEEQCDSYLYDTLPAVFDDQGVNVHDEEELTRAFKEYTSQYVSKEQLHDKETVYLLYSQLSALKNRLVNEYPRDSLIPYTADLELKMTLTFRAEPLTVEMCGLKFDLPAVDKAVHFKGVCDGEPVELLSSEIRQRPQITIVSKYHQDREKDLLFTLMIVDRSEANPFIGDHIHLVNNPDRPFINWMVVNIRGSDITTGYEIIEYMSFPESPGQYVFLYEQHETITDLAMLKYTTEENHYECWARNRCLAYQKELVVDYQLRLAAVARYNIKMDVYGGLYLVRWGRFSPDTACTVYIERYQQALNGGHE